MPYARGLYYRDDGEGDPPIVILHGGWGYSERHHAATCTDIVARFLGVLPSR